MSMPLVGAAFAVPINQILCKYFRAGAAIAGPI
jgi:hypothetical protein